MIGRYSNLTAYKEIFTSKDFIRATAGALLIPAALGAGTFSLLPNLPDLLLLTSVAVNGLPIVWSALKGVARRQMNVDELVSIAILACLFTGNFLEAAVVSTIMVLGTLVEEAVSDSARQAVRELMAATPDTAVVEKNGKEITLPTARIQKSDVLVIRQGQTVAVDGSIIEGGGSMDESAITGESVPRGKKEGEEVFAGSICVQGYLRVQAKAVGEDSTMGRIVSLVQAAEQSGTSSARLVDRYAAFFTPVILAAAGITFLVTQDLTRAVTVLIVGCPCSFLLAGPVTTVAAVGRAAKNGILVKGGTYLEAIARARVFCFDKTGTLTLGAPRVAKVIPGPHQTVDQVLSLAAAVEEKSLHPLARAMVAEAMRRGLSLPRATQIRTEAGNGIEGMVDGCRICIETAQAQSESGYTAVSVSRDGQAVGTVLFEDAPRPEAKQTIAALKALGVDKTVMISGDQEGPVARVAKMLGISQWFSGQKPEGKLTRLKTFQDQALVFVGDGINDAPALKLADAGIAMGLKGSDAALETADVVLMNDDLSRLPFLVALSRKMTQRIRLNIWLSLILNVLAVAAGALGFLTPVLGALFHNAGAILVVALAAALRYGPIESEHP